MIGRLRGSISADEVSGTVLIDVHGVGYEVTVPAGTLGRAPRVADGDVELVIHTHVREDALDLFGFANETERRVFRLLIGLPNVGPKTAIGVLSAVSVKDLSKSVRSGDVGRLTKIPGIGKKTAERLVLELKEKFAEDTLEELHEGVASPPAGAAAARLMSALTNMGYRSAEAERAIAALGPRVDSAPLAQLIREALDRLSS